MSLSLSLIAFEPDAQACGGCFGPVDTVTSVDLHNMVISLSPERTILWDQIQYSGNPKDFVWVLPLPTAEASIEIADQAFFDELSALTSPRVLAPAQPIDNDCVGCCDDDTREWQAYGGGNPGEPEVIVYREDVVGPYETVVLGSEDPDALQNWLVAHNYRVPEAVVPTIAHYVDRGDVFVVMRLAPGENVTAMQPVRVSFPGYMSTFPLEMVKVGAQGVLELNLIVFAEQRYEAANYGNVTIDAERLTFDLADNTSDYREVFEETIAEAGGRAWVTEAAYRFNVQLSDSPALEDYELIQADIPYPYLTRMRTKMLLEYLTEDLQLAVAADSSQVSSVLIAGDTRNDPADDSGCALGSGQRNHLTFAGLLFLAVAVAFRRKRR